MLSRYAMAGSLLLAVGLVSACSQGGTLADAQGASICKSIVDNKEAGLPGAQATWNKAKLDGSMPAYCEVTATLSPVEGSAITVVYRLPEKWNGKMLGFGGGGWAGNITLEAATEGLLGGYATAQTDGGQPSTDVFQNAWVSEDPIKATDFSWRAVHEMTVSGKKLLATYYGRPHDRALFQGCSTGGRMALMEAQRFPQDYDGIISGAPVYTLQTQTSSVMRNNIFRDEAALNEEATRAVHDSVMAACDKLDGVEDGLIDDPRQCDWDPRVLACSSGGATDDGEVCLSNAQQHALRTAYRGLHARDGSYAMLPLSRGGELGWRLFIATDGSGKEFSNGGGIAGIAPLLWGDDQPDLAQLSGDDVIRARESAFAAMYEADDPDLAPFFERGGKLLMWHGENDPGPSPVATIDYAERVQAMVPDMAEGSLRLFLAPGVEHCRGGPGPDRMGLLAALDAWLETGEAPDRLVATKDDGSITRPICAWPQIAHYKGQGDVNDPANYECGPRE